MDEESAYDTNIHQTLDILIAQKTVESITFPMTSDKDQGMLVGEMFNFWVVIWILRDAHIPGASSVQVKVALGTMVGEAKASHLASITIEFRLSRARKGLWKKDKRVLWMKEMVDFLRQLKA
ncbi:hypothetical protein U1Q18_019302 [Sarracenia purpurea var. burkii]